MSDPQRLAERDDLGAALLRAGRSLDATRAREQKRALYGGATVAAAAAVTVKAVPKTLISLAYGKWVVLGVVAAVAVVPVIHAASSSTEQARGAGPVAARGMQAAVVRAGAVLEPSAPASAEPAVPEGRDEGDLHGSAVVAPRAVSSGHLIRREAPALPVPAGAAPSASSTAIAEPAASAAPAPEPPNAEETLTHEVATLRAARAALRAGQPARARALLDEHDRRFPQGRLGIEAEVLRIEALALSGDTGAARVRAQQFLARHPDTPYASRVRAHAGHDGVNP
jgi:hypothetical protein